MGTSGKAMQGSASTAEAASREMSRTLEESEGHIEPFNGSLFYCRLKEHLRSQNAE